jgi:hypothetical protein
MTDSQPTTRHADALWVSAAFCLCLIAAAGLLIKGSHLPLAAGSILWTLCFGGLLFSSIRLLVIVIESVQATYFPAPPIGACTRCGYDLRGLRNAWRCPECGELYIDDARESTRWSRH